MWILIYAVLIKLLKAISFINSPLRRLGMRMALLLGHIEAQKWIGEGRTIGCGTNIEQTGVAYVLLSEFAGAETRWDNIIIVGIEAIGLVVVVITLDHVVV